MAWHAQPHLLTKDRLCRIYLCNIHFVLKQKPFLSAPSQTPFMTKRSFKQEQKIQRLKCRGMMHYSGFLFAKQACWSCLAPFCHLITLQEIACCCHKSHIHFPLVSIANDWQAAFIRNNHTKFYSQILSKASGIQVSFGTLFNNNFFECVNKQTVT